MKAEMKAAVEALKTALHVAIDDENFNRNHLSELWRHYNGVQTIYEGCPEDPADPFEDSIDPWHNPDYNFTLTSDYLDEGFGAGTVNAAGPVSSISFGAGADSISINTSGGADVISFGDYSGG